MLVRGVLWLGNGEESYWLEASKLLEKARRLRGHERIVFEYFLEEVSVGYLRAEMELKSKGVRDPETAIRRLEELGLLERGRNSISLVKPLRAYLSRRRGYGLDEIYRS